MALTHFKASTEATMHVCTLNNRKLCFLSPVRMRKFVFLPLRLNLICIWILKQKFSIFFICYYLIVKVGRVSNVNVRFCFTDIFQFRNLERARFYWFNNLHMIRAHLRSPVIGLSAFVCTCGDKFHWMLTRFAENSLALQFYSHTCVFLFDKSPFTLNKNWMHIYQIIVKIQ